jgi:hypothetical protein
MKKIIVLSFLLFSLTGCGNTMVCKTKDTSISEKYVIKYDDSKIVGLKTEKVYKFETSDEFKSFEVFMKHTENSNDNDNVEVSYKKKNKKYILTRVYKLDKISDDELSDLGISIDKDTMINVLKNKGLSCK